jgi:hypothetical protein
VAGGGGGRRCAGAAHGAVGARWGGEFTIVQVGIR